MRLYHRIVGLEPYTCSCGDSNLDTSDKNGVNQTHSNTLDCFERMISRNTLSVFLLLATRFSTFVLATPFTTSAQDTDAVFLVRTGTGVLPLICCIALSPVT